MTVMDQRATLASGEIEWGRWVSWTSIPGIELPAGPGVYEVVHEDEPNGERLQIGEAIHLGKHLRKYLFRDPRLSAVGGKIKAAENVGQLLVRWAETDNYHEVKSELKNLHLRRFGRLPKYGDR